MTKRHSIKPGSATAYVKAFEKFLFEKDFNRLEKRVIELVNENHQYGGSPDGFLYKGVFYNKMRTNIISKGQRGNLMPEMEPMMAQYFGDTRKIENDRTKITQMLANLLLPCKSQQDVRDALPECLVEQAANLKQLPRTREEAFTLNTPLLQQQYNEFKSLIDIYLVTRMFL